MTRSEQRTIPAEALVDASGEHKSEEVHRLRDLAVRDLEQQVVVVGHQTERVDLDAEAFGDHTEESFELDPVAVAVEDGLVRGATIEDVVPGASAVVATNGSRY